MQLDADHERRPKIHRGYAFSHMAKGPAGWWSQEDQEGALARTDLTRRGLGGIPLVNDMLWEGPCPDRNMSSEYCCGDYHGLVSESQKKILQTCAEIFGVIAHSWSIQLLRG